MLIVQLEQFAFGKGDSGCRQSGCRDNAPPIAKSLDAYTGDDGARARADARSLDLTAVVLGIFAGTMPRLGAAARRHYFFLRLSQSEPLHSYFSKSVLAFHPASTAARFVLPDIKVRYRKTTSLARSRGQALRDPWMADQAAGAARGEARVRNPLADRPRRVPRARVFDSLVRYGRRGEHESRG